MSYEDTLEWGRRAVAAMRGQTPTSKLFRAALREVNAPFTTVDACTLRFGGTVRQWMCDVLQRDTRAQADYRPALEVRPQLGPGVTVNRPDEANMREVWDELASSYHERKREVEAEERRSITIAVDRPDEPVAIIWLGDAHIGSPSTKYPRLLAILEQLKRRDIKVFCASIGDWLDQMIWPKVRFEGRASPLTVPKEIMAGAWWLKEAADAGRFLGIVAGNHDLMGANLSGFSALEAAMLTVRQAVPFGQTELLLDVTIVSPDGPGQTYSLEMRHKCRGNSIYTPAHGVNRHILWNHRNSDVVVCGHTHQWGTIERDHSGKPKYGIQLGAFKDSALDDYAKIEGFSQGQTGESDYGMLLWPDHHLIEPLKTEQAIDRVKAMERGLERCNLSWAPPPVQVAPVFTSAERVAKLNRRRHVRPRADVSTRRRRPLRTARNGKVSGSKARRPKPVARVTKRRHSRRSADTSSRSRRAA